MPLDQGLANKKQPGVKGNKVRLTYAFTSNMDGLEKRPAMVMRKAKKPQALVTRLAISWVFIITAMQKHG
jgi:hypothetical protein